MNTKVLLGIVAGAVILIAGFFLLRPAGVPAPTSTPNQDSAASNTPQVVSPKKPDETQPTFNIGTTTVKTVPAFALFNSNSFISTSTYPTITGTANTAKVGIVINNSMDVGILGTWEIPVSQGHWSYSSSVALPPGTYTLILFADNTITGTAKLTVKP